MERERESERERKWACKGYSIEAKEREGVMQKHRDSIRRGRQNVIWWREEE